MHYERAPRFRRSKPDEAPPPLRCCAGLRSATAGLERLLQKLVADGVTTHWVTYNALLRIFTRCKEEVDKLAIKLQSAGPEIPPAAGEKPS
jgi:hypothetical protein